MAMRKGPREQRRAPIVRFKPTDPPIDFKDVEMLAKFLGPHGQIISRKRSGLSNQRQRELKRAIKRARHVALLPFVG